MASMQMHKNSKNMKLDFASKNQQVSRQYVHMKC